eukprot:6460867-Amphidinium_carterae.1
MGSESLKVTASSMPIKGLLLDQEKAVSGVGNWVADEVLYHASIHPAAVSKTLSETQVDALHNAL